MLKPQIGKTYTAVVHYQEKTQIVELPLAQSEGFVMMVNNQPDKVNVFVYHQESMPQTGKLLLLAQQRGKVCYVAESSMSEASFSVNIPIQKFTDDGIVHFTLFTENNVPVCERIVYINLHKSLKINILADKTQYKPREKVTLQCQVSNADGIPQEGNFSITVTDAQQMSEKAFTQDIRSYLLLSSDIQGFIENPAYYFDETNAQTAHHLDLLLMTQGWRRFVWKQVLADSLPTPAYAPEYALTLAGSFSRTYRDKMPKDVNLTLMLKDDFEQQIVSQVPDLKTNTFKFDNVEYNGLTEIFLGITGKKEDHDFKIAWQKNVPPTIRTQVLQNEPLAWIDDKKAAEIFRKRLSNQPSRLLETVVVKGKSERTKLLHRPSLGIRPSYIFNIEKDSLENIGSVGALLDREAPSIGRNVETFSETRTNVKTKTVLYSIDGRTVDEATALSYPLSGFFSVTAYKRSMYLSAVSIRTRADIGKIFPMLYKVPGTIVEKRMGFVLAREFYSPQYDTPKPPNSPTDNRVTIYWNPVVKTDKNGKATVSFYTSDEKTTFRARMEGITPTGKIGVGKYNIN